MTKIDLSDISKEWIPEERLIVIRRISAMANHPYFKDEMPTDMMRIINLITDAPSKTLNQSRDRISNCNQYERLYLSQYRGFRRL